MRRTPMHMADWIKKLDAFLKVNEREILTHAGKISHEGELTCRRDRLGTLRVCMSTYPDHFQPWLPPEKRITIRELSLYFSVSQKK